MSSLSLRSVVFGPSTSPHCRRLVAASFSGTISASVSQLSSRPRQARPSYPNSVPDVRLGSSSSKAKMVSPPPNSEPPLHKMGYFPNMTMALPSESGEFRRVLWTGRYSQVVIMTVPMGGDIGDEVHTVDQILTFTSGTGLAQVGSDEQAVKAGDMVIVPAGTRHQFLNKGPTPLILYTVYSPAEHKATAVHKTMEEGDREEEGIDEPPPWSQRSKKENEDERWVG
ncbi:RmlC-like cupin domain-containing protein [Lasiosphaeria ovina]|uniref:RmlC-like cupin domain-containing protein n=1 Tax=Lasiosphaeria ovina TaxID=92902 RepID=A0AAE0KAJ1_9PEZI|nr:RmlC-like cupin domain-containing protein [Lasiosphaeria ovina]